ncbi:uncharacterized protein LOC127853868 [Dreissena polymorpha]|uniref:uncharacterized protein LOC127853868 n=1 Tax=Dreissena polymorpha TaxID=45954 RepID=UPI00226425BA|nr:uncharacterized protein LOC127853868 [Dreissena polymorpha]
MYTCNPGYDFIGMTKIRCLENGTWGALEAHCTIKDCQDPPVLHNGYRNATSTTYNSTVIYSCNPGYRMFGESSITCLDTGNWSELLVNCTIKDCGNTFMEKGECNATSTFFKSSARCSCHRGYHFTGINSSIECLANGVWSVVQGNCVINDCGQPPIGNLSTIHFPLTTVNATAIYACLPGYNTTHITELTCTADGKRFRNTKLCSDIDECLKRNTCHYNANCTNTDGSFKCECQTGYRDQDGVGGQRCADVDECAFDGDFFCMHALNQTRLCVNIDGGYVCVCNKGFTGSKCETDIIECNDTTTCGPHADCTNTYGGYSCACPDGYPQGNPYLGCFEPVMLDFKAAGDRYNGDNPMIDAYHISTRLPYLGEYINWFKPSMNGFISLDFQPLYNEYGGENASEWKATVQNHRVIAPLWTNIDSSNISDGGLWIHSFTNKQQNKTDDMAKIQDLIRTYTNQTEFKISVAMVATWKHVTVHSPYEPGYELVKHQNLSMQCILVSDGMYTYIMFNYDREQFSIRPLPEVPVASGYTKLDYTGDILSDRYNFTRLNQGSNVMPDFAGRWLYNVTVVTESMKNEILCQRFYKSHKIELKTWIQKQLEFALPCPCQEVLMMEDYTFNRNDSLRSGFGSHMTCYESWFFSAYGIKQRCCYMFSKLQTQYPGAVAAEFENRTLAGLLEKGYNQCCSPDGSHKYCNLYQEINPPDDCSRYTISDEIPTDGGSMHVIIGRVKKLLGL